MRILMRMLIMYDDDGDDEDGDDYDNDYADDVSCCGCVIMVMVVMGG